MSNSSRASKTQGSVLAYLGLGSNLGDRIAAIRSAVAEIDRLDDTDLVEVSSLWKTRPKYVLDQPDFLNACAAIRTKLEPEILLDELLKIENAAGRRREYKNGPRAIDLDILLWGDTIIDEPDLTVPHPAMTERAFVLAPLQEIAAEVVHPLRERTIQELWIDVDDRDDVEIFDESDSHR